MCYVPVDARRCRACVLVCICTLSSPPPHPCAPPRAYNCSAPAIFSDWAWPGFLLPCFLLCIPNYGGEFLGRATRIARFGLISSLNLDISRLQPFAPTPPPRSCALRPAPTRRWNREIYFSTFILRTQAVYLPWRNEKLCISLNALCGWKSITTRNSNNNRINYACVDFASPILWRNVNVLSSTTFIMRKIIWRLSAFVSRILRKYRPRLSFVIVQNRVSGSSLKEYFTSFHLFEIRLFRASNKWCTSISSKRRFFNIYVDMCVLFRCRQLRNYSSRTHNAELSLCLRWKNFRNAQWRRFIRNTCSHQPSLRRYKMNFPHFRPKGTLGSFFLADKFNSLIKKIPRY